MFSNATLVPSIDCHQCVWFLRARSTLRCFEVTDRIIVICSSPSPEGFDLSKSPWGQKKKRKLNNNLISAQRLNCNPPLPGRKEGVGGRGGRSRGCFTHILSVTVGNAHSTFRPWALICRGRWRDCSSGAVHRTHSTGRRCRLLASPVSALCSARLIDYPLTLFVFVDVDCWAISVSALMFIYPSGPLLSSLDM